MKAGLLLGLGAIVLAALFLALAPGYVERQRNRIESTGTAKRPAEAAHKLHTSLVIADLHADSLLWHRDLLARGTRGHVDVPRLLEGNVALQVFSIVTQTPRGLNIKRNDDRSDNITLLAVAQRWPVKTWGSLKERALHQAARLHGFAARSQGKLVIVKSAADLRVLLERKRSGAAITGGILSVEGAHALEGDLANLDALYDAGVRLMAPSHFFDTEVGGSAHGVRRGGLTALGREWVRRMETKRMVIDLAHASTRTLDEVLALATRPVIVSHTGIRATCPNRRNLNDDQLRRIAATGGVIGIGYWGEAVCSRDVASIARAIRYTANIVGVGHVALGSDFDGAVPVPFDTAQLVQLTQALIDAGFTHEELGKIMGGNVMRLFLEIL